MAHKNEITPMSSDDEDECDEKNDEDSPQEDEESSEDESDDAIVKPAASKVYLPKQGASDTVELECDKSAYIFYHAVKSGAPCLSFDVVKDKLGDDRADRFPMSMTLVAGTQLEGSHSNNLIVIKLTDIKKRKKKSSNSDSEDSGSEESDNEEDDEGTGNTRPTYQCAKTSHVGGINRLRVTNHGKPIVASWSENGKVYLWDITNPVRAVSHESAMVSYIQNREAPRPLYVFNHHMEGFAMDWSPLTPGMLATGDCNKFIYLWTPTEGGSWQVNQKPYASHTNSVEDIQWSPNENNVMASCSVDKSIRIWDIRVAPVKACMLTKKNAHDSDVNVIHWNRFDPFLLSGGDDGKIRVWDLRKFPDGPPLCTFKHHTAPITSVEWHPTDRSVFAASGADDQLTLWDLAVEKDAEQEEEVPYELKNLPAQLLFIHQGQQDIKELHWHCQMPGVLVSTAQSGFNLFRTLSV